MKNNEHGKSFSLRSVTHFFLKYFTLAILATVVLSGCGSGGGGGSGATTSSANGETVLASQEIGVAGGALVTSDGKVSIVIPSGSLASTTTITVKVTGEKGIVGDVYEFGPSGISFSQPVTVTIAYDPAC